MNIVIVGQGAIGLLWYYKLSQQAENHVTLQCSDAKPHHDNLMNFTDTNGVNYHQKVSITSENDFKNAEIVFFCLKAYQIEKALNQYSQFINPSATAILSHNGLLAHSTQSNNAFKAELLLLTTHGSLRETAFQITHTGIGHCDIGLLNGNISSPEITALVSTLNSALPDVYWQEKIQENQWLKLAINSVINPITAIYNIDNGDVAKKQFQPEIQEILQEVILIAEKNNITLSLNSLVESVLNVANKTAKNCSSMRSDILEKRQTEIDHINGFIRQQGLLHNIATPKNSEMWQWVKSLETND